MTLLFARLSMALAVLVLCAARPAQATTFVAVGFDELVSQADMIFVGDVVDVRPYTLRTRDGVTIRTQVTFRVDDPIFGAQGLVEVLDFLGGEADGFGMRVDGMPQFKVGDRNVIFARRVPSISPIVGFNQGLMHVTRDGLGVDRIVSTTGGAFTANRVSDLRDRIVRTLAQQGRR
jgi:hypothetical protein